MPIRYQARLAVFEGHCTVEEAHELAEWLLAGPSRKVRLSGCTGVHAAVLQCLMALGPAVVAGPSDAGLAQWLAAALPAPLPPPASGRRPPRRRSRTAPRPGQGAKAGAA